ncbi:MAG: thioredoxin [Gemmatimonadota bacterium]|nr:thioredoxin [Gemmatimonadota bacterium]
MRIALDRPLPITDESFDRTISQSEVPVLVDFYADWCGPCRQMSPVIDALAADQQGRALIAKLDTDRNQRTMERFGVRGIPTVIVFSGGREVARRTGAVGARELQLLLARAG